VTKAVFISIFVLFGLNSVTVQAKIYKFVDDNGQVHYSEKKPLNMRSKQLDINSGGTQEKRKSKGRQKKIKIIANKDLDQAVREGKITKTIATRMRHFNIVSKEYSLMKKKKKAMKLAIASAKSNRSSMTLEQIKHLEQEYDTFVKEDYYYARQNYVVSRKKIQSFLESHSKKKSSSLPKKSQRISLEWH
jgi:hypothetical protein